MGRYYKRSVKGQLTRWLILILVTLSLAIYMLAGAVFIYVRIHYSHQASQTIQALTLDSLESQMWSKAGSIGMHFQEFVNDAYMMGVNLQKLSKNEIKQNP